jgi:hypothetical protein
MRFNYLGFLSSLLLISNTISFAATKLEYDLPKEMQLNGKKLVLNGVGLRRATILKVKVYAAGLYLEKKSQSPEEIMNSPELKRVDMKFLHDVSAEDIREKWVESFNKNCKEKCESVQENLKKLNEMMPSVKSGDSMAYTLYPDRVDFLVNGQKRGEIKSKQFSRFLLTTWLGDAPPSDELKEGMLGKNS